MRYVMFENSCMKRAAVRKDKTVTQATRGSVRQPDGYHYDSVIVNASE